LGSRFLKAPLISMQDIAGHVIGQAVTGAIVELQEGFREETA
jgi:hypothetical protein